MQTFTYLYQDESTIETRCQFQVHPYIKEDSCKKKNNKQTNKMK